ncbi:hypothetical protein NLJ89_g9276 [Agrocybe chaxingu]|uniref:Uncharacterized protein n=1 Tax=Agrocybe chaxingu TaxID=84603 RepID=A0A9W8MTP6_9AGAR|nr:hypothetical protein NLJ89_g9276 [Agrocybe chaxingu]
MEFALTAASYLKPVAEGFVYINTTKVHPVWFPYPLAPTLHAARISIIYQSNIRRSSSQQSWGTYLIGYLIMCWGGGILSHFLLGLPPPMLYSFHPAINYITVHLAVTLLFKILPDLLYPPILDTVLWPLDALLRTNAVTSTLGLLYAPSVHPEYQNSALTHMIVGGIVSAGGGVAVGTLGAFSTSWSFTTPPILRAGAGWAGTLDVWGGALVALIYSSTTNHPAFASLKTYTTLLLSSPFLSATRKPHADADFPPLSTLEAKSLAYVVLAALFAARVAQTHWLDSTPAPKAANTVNKKPKKKTQ